MKKKDLILAIVYFVFSVLWGLVAYEKYVDANLTFSCVFMLLAVGYMALSVFKLYEYRKNK